jgi:hypothetical protein
MKHLWVEPIIILSAVFMAWMTLPAPARWVHVEYAVTRFSNCTHYWDGTQPMYRCGALDGKREK